MTSCVGHLAKVLLVFSFCFSYDGDSILPGAFDFEHNSVGLFEKLTYGLPVLRERCQAAATGPRVLSS